MCQTPNVWACDDVISCYSALSPTKMASTTCYNCQSPNHLAKDCPADKTCYHCNESGHLKRDCPLLESTGPSYSGSRKTCFNCRETGHVKRDCPHLRSAGFPDSVSKKTCYHCNRVGHIIRDCPMVGSDGFADESTKTCYHCNERGHFKRDCPHLESGSFSDGYSMSSGTQKTCYNCNEYGHVKRECPYLENLCYHCSERGHMKRDCPLLEDGSFTESEGRQSGSTKVCYHCNERGHVKRDCPLLKSDHSAQPQDSVLGLDQELMDLAIPFIDTHCHLDYVFERASHSGTFGSFIEQYGYPKSFGGCITMVCDPAAFSSFGLWKELLEEGNVYGAFGIHPHHAQYYNDDLESKVLEGIAHPRCVAFGEIGLDYSKHSPSSPEVQKRIFKQQLELAVGLGKPIVLHCRDAEEDMLQILQSCSIPPETKIHLHCCSTAPDVTQRFLDAFPNLFIGITCNVTYHSTKDTVQKTVQVVDLERVLLETDSPYLTPTGYKQRWNHPTMVLRVAEKVAELKQIPIEDVLQQTTKNAESLFNLHKV